MLCRFLFFAQSNFKRFFSLSSTLADVQNYKVSKCVVCHTDAALKRRNLCGWKGSSLPLNFLFGSNHLPPSCNFPLRQHSTCRPFEDTSQSMAQQIKFWVASFNGVIIDTFIERFIRRQDIQHFHCQEFSLFPVLKQSSWVNWV